MLLIGLVGTKSAGKDTFADHFISSRKNTEEKIVKYAFATPLKKACKELFLLSDSQLSGTIEKETIDERWGLSPRQIFQMVGTDFIRNHIDPNFWLTHFEYWLDSQLSTSIVIVSDVRFQNEADLIKNKGGVLVKINRSEEGVKPDDDSTNTDSHISEVGVDSITGIDYLIQNSGTIEHYYHQIDCFSEWLATIFSG